MAIDTLVSSVAELAEKLLQGGSVAVDVTNEFVHNADVKPQGLSFHAKRAIAPPRHVGLGTLTTGPASYRQLKVSGWPHFDRRWFFM